MIIDQESGGHSPEETRVSATGGAEDVGADNGGQGADDAPQTPPPVRANSRDRIYAASRQQREDQEGDGFHAYASPEEERRVFGRNVQTTFDRDAEREAARNPQPTREEPDPDLAPAPTRYKLKVHGQEVELDQDKVLELAQQAAAAGNILEQAKSIRAVLVAQKAELDRSASAANHSGAQQPAPAQRAEPENPPADDELDAIIDSIQVGDQKDAKIALQKYGASLENRIMQRIGDIDSRIEQTSRTLADNDRRKAQSATVLSEFAAAHPEFSKSESLQQALFTETVSAMRQHILDLGVQPETLAAMQREHNLDDKSIVGYAYRHLQNSGFSLPDHGTVLRSSAQNLRKQFGLQEPQQQPSPTPTPPAQVDIRRERKEQMGQQPRRASIAPQTGNPEPNITDTRREAIRQLRIARRGRA